MYMCNTDSYSEVGRSIRQLLYEFPHLRGTVLSLLQYPTEIILLLP